MSQAVALMPQMSPEQVELIKSTIAKGATADELKLFLYRCANLGLDPLKPGQIYFIKYNPSSPGTIVVGIEGFRSNAARTGKISGVKRGVIKDEKGNLTGAWAEIYRSDWTHPAREEVPFAEYNTGKGSWAKMPETMIKKVAEAAALRMAFPDNLGGVYIQEEMDQADRGGVFPEQPPVDGGDGVIDHPSQGYKITFGKYGGRSLEEIDLNDLRSYVDYIEKKAAKDNQPITGKVKEFIERAVAHITAFENGDAIEVGST